MLPNGSLNTAFDPGRCITLSFPNGIESIAFTTGNRIIAGGGVLSRFGCPYLFMFLPSGALDTSFLPLKGANGPIECHAVRSDGKIMIGGSFTLYNGIQRVGIARLNADGTLDPTFDPGIGVFNDDYPGKVIALVVQPDGKVVITGAMTTVNGIAVNKITRLNADGSLDISFNETIQDWSWGYDDVILLPTGKIITSVMAGTSGFALRFDQDGQDETSFFNTPTLAGGGAGMCLALQPDGKILIGGGFTVNGIVARIARLNTTGSLDTGFDPGSGANERVRDVDVAPDGRILVSGAFTAFNGVPCGGIARLQANGSLDASFATGTGSNAEVRSSSILADGRIIVTGSFTTFNGATCNGLCRLLPNGDLDGSFTAGTGANGVITRASPLPNGQLIITGSFTNYQNIGRNRIARINGTPRAGIKLMLEGPYSGTSMNDALRSLPSFPLTEPFTAMGYAETGFTSGATIGSSVLTTTGNNAIVDWVLVEMRPVATPGTVAASRAVLLQRDGDVVDLDGVSTVGFAGLAPGNYCVAVKPRNHLPVMLSTTTPVSYGSSGIATVDFTLPTTQVYDNDARKNVSGVMVLAAGDGTFNETVRYTGSGNDRDPIILRVGGSTPNNTVSGYWREDLNMDGVVKYTGSANDRDIILTNVGSTTPNNTRVATLP